MISQKDQKIWLKVNGNVESKRSENLAKREFNLVEVPHQFPENYRLHRKMLYSQMNEQSCLSLP